MTDTVDRLTGRQGRQVDKVDRSTRSTGTQGNPFCQPTKNTLIEN